MRPALAHNAYRLQTANNEDCVGLFTEQSSLMLCYELPGQRLLSEGEEFARVNLGTEYLLPVTSSEQANDTGTRNKQGVTACNQVLSERSEFTPVQKWLRPDCSAPATNTNNVTDPIPTTLPLLMFPKGGFLADVLTAGCLPAVMRDYPVEVVCESAFAISLKEMVLAGMGVAWLPAALVQTELKEQKLISLADALGRCDLTVSLYYRCLLYTSPSPRDS